ncbi:hypothetical protein GCM10023165_26280 [Variovorax defluvii]|uniref:Uncharacterized protein n=1 Tax=Variovorax defluvii TaxID=913761 RepID=A0ABP8HSE3_9BURK
MSIALLHRIANAHRFPVILTSDADIKAFRTLFRAGHVIGAMQAIPSLQVGVVVTEITPQGKLALEAAKEKEAKGKGRRMAAPPVNSPAPRDPAALPAASST